MLVTGRHAKHMQNYDYLNWVRIMHIARILSLLRDAITEDDDDDVFKSVLA